jgi:hypothetical protein
LTTHEAVFPGAFTGLLERGTLQPLLPDLARLTGRVKHDGIHAFTTDAHLARCGDVAAAIVAGAAAAVFAGGRRGLRAVADFEYEFQMTAMNQRLNDDIETVFLMADPRHQAIASRLVKEIARLDGAIDSFVSPGVAAAVRARVHS